MEIINSGDAASLEGWTYLSDLSWIVIYFWRQIMAESANKREKWLWKINLLSTVL